MRDYIENNKTQRAKKKKQHKINEKVWPQFVKSYKMYI